MGIDTTQLRDNLAEQLGQAKENQEQVGTGGEIWGKIRKELAIALCGLREVDCMANLPLKIDALYRARNLTRLMISGIDVDDERLLEFADDSLKNVEPLRVKPELIRGLAKSLFEAKRAEAGETIVITGAARNIEIMEEIARLCMENDVSFVMDIMPDDLEAVLINNSDDEGLKRLGEERTQLYEPASIKLEVRSNASADYDADKLGKYAKALAPYSKRLVSGELPFSLTLIPTEKDAELDDMEYGEYMDFFFETCDQPWEAMREAQQILVERLNETNELQITNEDGTDLGMSIEGFTFANSGADVNIPGAEVFSAPGKHSLNGTLVAKGEHKYGPFPVVKDITIVFEDGKIVEAHAEEGEETLKQIIGTDEGASFVGEVAFGTNPHLRKPYINGLLVEKVTGSFHLALGASYTFDEYGGEPVNVNNGNESDVHWDITTMLMNKGGKVHFDGKLVQDDGIWLDEEGSPDERLRVLNEGWGVLPSDQQPDWWKEKYPDGYQN